MNREKIFNMVAKTQQGLEPLLADEIRGLGGKNVEEHKRAVSFDGDKELLYRVNLWSRLALKVLVPLTRFEVRNERDLYEEIRRINWEDHLDVNGTLAIDSIVQSRFFNHSKYVALKTKDAIVDQFRDAFEQRPSVDTVLPDLRINVHIREEKCTLSLDSSGDSLHRRGYRADANLAPLNEVTAAALVKLSGWNGEGTFMDPMCGSGTILIEAAMFAKNMAPGSLRKQFGFETWKDFDSSLWQRLKKEAEAGIKETETVFIGGDKVFKVIEIARNNVSIAGLDEDIRLSNKQFEEQKPPAGGGTVIMNPPYGERLPVEEINAFYKSIGDKLKKDFTGFDVWILSSNKDAMKKIGLAANKRLTVWNGPLECKFHKFEVYSGTREKTGEQ